MSAAENLSYQGELPAVSYRRNDSPDATAKVGELRLACRLVRNRRRGIHQDGGEVSGSVSTESTAGAGLGIGSSYAVTIL
jgi:hypothetical protein